LRIKSDLDSRFRLLRIGNDNFQRFFIFMKIFSILSFPPACSRNPSADGLRAGKSGNPGFEHYTESNEAHFFAAFNGNAQ